MIRDLFSEATLHKLVWSALVIIAVAVVHYLCVAAARLGTDNAKSRGLFWTRQISSLLSLAGVVAALFGIWSGSRDGKALPLGLVSAGIAVALQKVWTAFAGYLV